MKYELIHDNGSDRLILIFAGWSTDAYFYTDTCVDGYDVMVVYDYSDLTFPLHILGKYSSVSVFAWSLGVFAASRVIPPWLPAMAVAVNGTETPVDDNYGIPKAIFEGTAANLNARNLMKFRRRMCGNDYADVCRRFPDIPVDRLKMELEAISALSAPSQESVLYWDCAYISMQDVIFPAANQLKAWKSHPSEPELRILDLPHYIDISKIIRGAVPAHSTVGEKFRKALSSYSDNAMAQKEIAGHLLDLIPDKKFEKVVEIGPGSGVFTDMFCRRFTPREMDYVDLYNLPRYGLSHIERYHLADAEEWIWEKAEDVEKRREDTGRTGSYTGSHDAIVSASAMQWFVNPRRFIMNAARLLRPGGIFACSTFLPGNLPELSKVNPYGLIYRSKEAIGSMLKPYFSHIVLEQKEIVLNFPSSRELLIHLRQTGVGGSSASGLPLSRLLSSLPTTLTYRPLFIIASKKRP